MSVTLEELQQYVDKEAIFHVVQDDNTLAEVTGTIKAATVAGIAYKEKGKSGLELIPSVDKIEEITYAPTKAKSISQKSKPPVEFGQARQHLVDAHGVALSWAKDATEKDAFEYHNGLDHSDLGHKHLTAEEVAAKAAKKADDERAAALAAESPAAPQG